MQETTRVLLNWSLLGETRAALRKHGLKFPRLAVIWLYYRLLNVWHESRFDRRYGVTTGFIVASKDLAFDDAGAQDQAVRYRPTPPFTVSRGIRKLQRLCNLDYAEQTFVDYGSGAGRIMIIAAESGFGSVVGIELSPKLVDICNENIRRYRTLNSASELACIKHNAASYDPPPNATVFFFFVPFGAEIYAEVLARIKKSVERNPRTVYILDIGSYLRSFDFEQSGCKYLASAEKLSIYSYDAR